VIFFVPMSPSCPYHNREIGTAVNLYTAITYIYLSLCPYLFSISNNTTKKTDSESMKEASESVKVYISRVRARTRVHAHARQTGTTGTDLS